jgi:hypothetical protein
LIGLFFNFEQPHDGTSGIHEQNFKYDIEKASAPTFSGGGGDSIVSEFPEWN